MEPLVIVIVIVLVLSITFILSRPFWKAAQAQGAAQGATHLATYGGAENSVVGNEDFEQEYQELMHEISSLEAQQDENLNLQDSEIFNQIEAKKDQAANLLHLIQPTIKEQAGIYESQHNTPIQDDTLDAVQICPQCGSQTLTNDKFCSKCGHRLLP
jgi:rubrerythrin